MSSWLLCLTHIVEIGVKHHNPQLKIKRSSSKTREDMTSLLSNGSLGERKPKLDIYKFHFCFIMKDMHIQLRTYRFFYNEYFIAVFRGVCINATVIL
jgi:hypothetical protein